MALSQDELTLGQAPLYRTLRFYPLFSQAETARWTMEDIPWDRIEDDKVDENLVEIVHRAALTEMTTYEATERFMHAFRGDVDFTQWISVWFYEETKHPHALMRWLDHFGRAVTRDEMLSARTTYPFVDSRIGTLAINVMAEMVAADGYLRLAAMSPEPVLTEIVTNLARDEARHASGFYAFARKALEQAADPVKEKRTVLLILHMWFRQRQRMLHPGMLHLRELAQQSDEEPRPADWLEVDGEETLQRICRMFALLLDEPGLTRPSDIRSLLQRYKRAV